MKKFLGKLFTFALYAFVIGAIAKAGYDIYSSKTEADKVMELAARFENYVPEEVAPYVENPDLVQYYYKSIGGDLYSGQSWEMKGIPSYVTMTGGGFEEQDVSLYYSNIGDNRIVDVLKYNEGSSLGLLDPENYVVSPAGNKVILKKEYLQNLKPNTKMEYGVRLADGTIVYEFLDNRR